MSGCVLKPGLTNSPISTRPSGVKLSGFSAPDSAMAAIRSMGSITTSAAGVPVRVSFMMVPIPSTWMVTLTPVFFSKAAATSVRPELEITPGLITRISAAAA